MRAEAAGGTPTLDSPVHCTWPPRPLTAKKLAERQEKNQRRCQRGRRHSLTKREEAKEKNEHRSSTRNGEALQAGMYFAKTVTKGVTLKIKLTRTGTSNEALKTFGANRTNKAKAISAENR